MVRRGRRQTAAVDGQPQPRGGRHTKLLQDRRLSKTVLESQTQNRNCP